MAFDYFLFLIRTFIQAKKTTPELKTRDSSSILFCSEWRTSFVVINCRSHVMWECGKQTCCPNHIRVTLLVSWICEMTRSDCYIACRKHIQEARRDISCGGNDFAISLAVDTFLLLHGTYRHIAQPWSRPSRNWFIFSSICVPYVPHIVYIVKYLQLNTKN